MTHELERLKQGLAEEGVVPRPRAKQAAIVAALEAFDAAQAASEKSTEERQGSGLFDRLRIAARAASDILTGKKPMRMTHALAGGASLAVLTLAVMTTVGLQNIGDLRWREAAPSPAATDAEKAEEVRARIEVLPPPSPPEMEVAEAVAGTSADELQDYDAAASLSGDAGAPAEQLAIGEVRRDAAAPAAPMTLQAAPGVLAEPVPPPAYREQGRDRFEMIETNPVKVTAEEPVSTFSIDVDTASYSFMRAALNNGVLPQDDAVRVEELINYFPYDYSGPETREEPFAANVSVIATPWNPETRLLHIGIKGYEIEAAERPRANLVFLLDTSGSMEEPNKLPLLVNSLKLLVDTLAPQDTVSIVAYAGSAGIVLEPTRAADKAKIIAALDNLWAGGSTAGGEGIRQAYQLAEQSFVEGGVNRVILATDGDFNVGITDPDELTGFVERERETGIFLSVLGFGRGNYNDELMQALAQNGNGAAAYIDTLNEARKVLVEEAGSTMFPIAKDVKIQVEFNPATVSEYRLIGYETRLLNRGDFNNDRVDAGEIGSGHTVTAIYEITPAGSAAELIDDLRYGDAAPPAAGAASEEYAFLRIRYKLPESDTSELIERPITTADETAGPGVSEARFAASVAGFAQLLRGGRYTGDFDYDDVIALAQANKGADEFGYRAEFVNLVRLAKSAASMERQQP